jgi:hypothetical protein
MSTELREIPFAGPQEEDLSITRFWGGGKKGTCYQLTQINENNEVNYVQLSFKELEEVMTIIVNEVSP